MQYLLKIKKKKLSQAKYIAQSAGLPSGLNRYSLLEYLSLKIKLKLQKI